MPKKSIREQILARRKHLSDEVCLRDSLLAQERLMATSEFASAGAVALYSPIWNELFTEEVGREALKRGKRVAYPRVSNQGLEFVEIEARSELTPGAYGILEPTGCKILPVASIDMIVVPGVAFDIRGGRLGYGKGFYDRVLHRRMAGRLVGLCYELQVVEHLPIETHDVLMDLVITERRIVRPATRVARHSL